MSQRQRIVFLLGCALVLIKSASGRMSCREFSRGVSFNSSDALGTWYSIESHRAGTYPAKCAIFSEVTEQERKDIKDLIAPYVLVKWENLELKLDAACLQTNDDYKENTIYYFERLSRDGSYMTLQLPSIHTSIDEFDYNRHPMRLKLVGPDSIAIMDCEDNYIFILTREANRPVMHPSLKNILRTYMPEEDD